VGVKNYFNVEISDLFLDPFMKTNQAEEVLQIAFNVTLKNTGTGHT
jgi:hypothetical protein